MDASELDYVLPEELIAQTPLADRSGARLLCVQRHGSELLHRQVDDLPELLRSALWVVNDTKVIPARLYLNKSTGGRVEFLLVERVATQPGSEHWVALGRTRKGVRLDMQLTSEDARLSARVIEMRGGGEVVLELSAADGDVAVAIEQVGSLPLPPYIRRAPDASDLDRYQTVFAKEAGAVAAPTAGLHLSEALIARLIAAGNQLAYVTLHVGPGTFAPLRAEDLREHTMHAEQFVIPEATAVAISQAKREGRPVVAVGTTVVRTLEANAADGGVRAGAGKTSIFIYPPHEFRVVDALLTNFHLPRSTLLALVMAFAGQATARAAYAEAVKERYRFFSYGDAMLIRSGK
ncbi:MAG TPA: tRNA preQ1(34) S-adenosylmethionine ribosyltransferase-isomerase QueA [Polyangiales bacterium]|nr:tRNA preQ1(34) S-adenosylmethionine ribosyltransferase-isomerase QueA [Polyangiales bacterium]